MLLTSDAVGLEERPINILSRVGIFNVPEIRDFVLTRELLEDLGIYCWAIFNERLIEKREPISEMCRVVVDRLEQSSSETLVRKELGNKTIVSVGHFMHIIRQQSQGQTGPLSVDENSYNLIHALDINLEPCIIKAYWKYGMWNLGLYSMDYRDHWDVGCQVLSYDQSRD